MTEYYSLIEVFVHPPLRDNIPNAVLEAMACGKAILATPVGGILEILEDGKNGVIVNVNDATTLAENIQEFLIYAEKRTSLGNMLVKSS